jgi:translation elongation factor EF-4
MKVKGVICELSLAFNVKFTEVGVEFNQNSVPSFLLCIVEFAGFIDHSLKCTRSLKHCAASLNA